MAEKVVDCRGKACPIPVLEAKKALEEVNSGTITVLVDNKASKENVKRFAEKTGCTVEIVEENGVFKLRITKGTALNVQKESKKSGDRKTGNYAVLMASTYVGEDKELGKILTKGFIKTFVNADPLPSKIILINTAVKLACKDSEPEILDALKTLEEKGVEVICCATCLDYLNLLDELEVGAPSNAYDVVQALANSDSVIRL